MQSTVYSSGGKIQLYRGEYSSVEKYYYIGFVHLYNHELDLSKVSILQLKNIIILDLYRGVNLSGENNHELDLSKVSILQLKNIITMASHRDVYSSVEKYQ